MRPSMLPRMISNSGRVWQFLRCPPIAPLGLLVGYSLWVVKNDSKMFEELFAEINDSQGEIFDVIEYKEEWEKDDTFDVERYINGNTDYWH